VRRDLLLRHDRTVHAKDGGIPLHSDVKRRKAPSKSTIAIDPSALEQIEASSDGMVDLETAAMLMTDLHHKATAAMRNAGVGPFENGPGMAFSHNGATLMEPSVTYPSGAISLPQWDAFMPQSVSEPKAHSISSSGSGSQDSRASFPSVSTQHPRSNQLPPIVGQPASGYNELVPALQAMINSLPATAATTPGHNSPSAAPNGPQSPTDHRKSPSLMHQASAPKAPQVWTDEERNIILDNIRNNDGERAIPESFRLPGLASLNRFLSTYFNLFHHHLPFLHPASFEPTRASPPLLLAILSIGALYAFDQDQAYMLHIGSKVLVSQFLQNKENFS
jgi:Fungal specific transcription factor domain